MLALDFGNSRLKWALFKADKITGHNAVSYGAGALEVLLDQENLPLQENKIMVSYVASEPLRKNLISYFEARGCEAVCFARTERSQCGVHNSYDVIKNMGVDRWLAMIEAYHHSFRKPDESVCIIDCGTAITLDFVGHDGRHLGGLIMPGYQTMYKALMDKTSNVQEAIELQEIKDLELAPDLLTESARVMPPAELSRRQLGVSTVDCVEQGCAQLIIEGVSGIIDKHRKNHEGKLCCIVTGGDGQWLAESLQGDNLVEPFLVLQGLQRVGTELK